MVIAIIAILAALLLPALAKAKVKAQGIGCMNNTKQITLAWIIYAQDNDEQLLGAHAWVGGVFDPPPNEPGPDSTNINILKAGPLNQNLGGNCGVYRCPGDPRKYMGESVVRSYSMNGYIGNDQGDIKNAANYLNFPKSSSMTRPGPSRTFVMLDESAISMNDGFFVVNMAGFDPYLPFTLAFVDVPATYHNKAGSLSFADGHSEIHKWRDPRTVTARLWETSAKNQDIMWLQERTTTKRDDPTR